MRTPQNVARFIGVARHSGYEVEVRVVAVTLRQLAGQSLSFREDVALRGRRKISMMPSFDVLRISLEKAESERLVNRVN